MLTFREGDIVSVEATVRFDFHGSANDRLYLNIEHSSASVEAGKAALTHPFLKEGETVRHVSGKYGVVIATKGRMAWVEDNEGFHFVWPTECVTHFANENRPEADVDADNAIVAESIGASVNNHEAPQ